MTLHAPASNILCFRYVGDGAIADEPLDALNLALREEFNASGEGWITTTMLGGVRVLRATLMNPRTTPGDLDRVLDGLAGIGARLTTGQVEPALPSIRSHYWEMDH